jgi:hypothetical protein
MVSNLEAADSWPMATFPSRGQLCRFVDEVRVWNRVEGLPNIRIAVLADGLRLRFWSEADSQPGVRRFIDSFGAWIQPGSERLLPPAAPTGDGRRANTT